MEEILKRIEAIDATVHIARAKKSERYGQGPWMAWIKGERDGLTIETKPSRGETPEEAMSAAWAMFSPAEKLVEPTMLPAPAKPDGVDDADFDEVLF